MPDCYSNCHEHCGLDFSLKPKDLESCEAMDFHGRKCLICGHLRDDHRHYNTLWKEVEEDEKVVDKAAEKKYNEAKTEKEKKLIEGGSFDDIVERAKKVLDEVTLVTGVRSSNADI